MRRNRTHRRVIPLLLAAVALTWGLGGAVYAFVIAPLHTARGAPRLSIRSQTPRQSVSPGWSVTYRVRIRRSPASRIWLSVQGPLPANFSARFRPQGTRSSMTILTLQANSRAHPGTHRVTLRARACFGRRCHARYVRTVVTVSTIQPPHRSFAIRGTPALILAPGVPAAVDLRLTNPHRYVLSVGYLAVRVESIRAPRADAGHPCTLSDFSVQQYSGPYGIRLPAARTRSLSALRVPPGRWPQITLLNRPVNQDGCKDATYTLRFTGTAIRGHEAS